MTKVGQGGQYQLLLGVRHLGLSFSTWTVSDDFVESDAQVLGRQLLRRVRCLGFPGAESGVGRSLVSRRTDEASGARGHFPLRSLAVTRLRGFVSANCRRRSEFVLVIQIPLG